jgi:hypothetical protein
MPFCGNCGQMVSDQAAACPQCGHPTGHGMQQQVLVQTGATPGIATASLVLGIVSILISFLWFIGLIPGIIAVALGFRARDVFRTNPGLQGSGVATAGLVCGWVGIGLSVLIGVLLIIFAIALSHTPGYYCC